MGLVFAFKTAVTAFANDFFEFSAKDGNSQSFNIEVISPIEVEVIKPTIAKANAEGIHVVIVNLL